MDAYEPSPEEIRKACEEIRREWSEETFRQRAVGLAPREWFPPGVKRHSDEPEPRMNED